VKKLLYLFAIILMLTLVISGCSNIQDTAEGLNKNIQNADKIVQDANNKIQDVQKQFSPDKGDNGQGESGSSGSNENQEESDGESE
jgi:peptidoglycan hydrolase CwlO-like protein